MLFRSKAMVFPVVVYGCESWTMKKAECQRVDAFELWCWRRLLSLFGASLVTQRLKRLPPMWETRVRSLGREDPLEKEMANPLQYSCLENPRDGGAWWAAVYGVAQSWKRLKRLSSSSQIFLNVPSDRDEVRGYNHSQLRTSDLQN